MKKYNNKHRGELLKEVIASSDLNISIITKRAGYNRSSYYNHITNPDLSFHILQKYGKAMSYDFSNDFQDMKSYITFDPPSQYGEPPTLEGMIRERDLWKDKYVQLLEKYNAMIEQHLNKD